jgi:hypothetical protein
MVLAAQNERGRMDNLPATTAAATSSATGSARATSSDSEQFRLDALANRKRTALRKRVNYKIRAVLLNLCDRSADARFLRGVSVGRINAHNHNAIATLAAHAGAIIAILSTAAATAAATINTVFTYPAGFSASAPAARSTAAVATRSPGRAGARSTAASARIEHGLSGYGTFNPDASSAADCADAI